MNTIPLLQRDASHGRDERPRPVRGVQRDQGQAALLDPLHDARRRVLADLVVIDVGPEHQHVCVDEDCVR